MSNSISYKNKVFQIGDTISLTYKLKEGEKERKQVFKGILIKIKGDSEQNRMITVRKISNSGIGVERIIPLISPFLTAIKLIKKGHARRSKLYFIRDLSDQQLIKKVYRSK